MLKNSSVEKNEVEKNGSWEDGMLSSTSQSFNLSTFLMIVSLLLVFGSTGCGKEEVAPARVAPVKKVVAPVETAMTTEKMPEYVYNPAGKRDPFKTFIESVTEKKERAAAPVSPLQSYDLNALRLVGIMMLPGKKVAIVEDPSGKGYHVKVGTHIGLNDGVVVEILKDEVIVEEKYLDETLQTKARKVSVKIPKEEGQGGEVR